MHWTLCVPLSHRCWLWVWLVLHFRAEAGHQDPVAGPGRHWPDVGAGAQDLAAQRAPLRRPDGSEQGRDGHQARRGPGEDLETLLWHSSSRHGPRAWLLHYHQQGKIWYLQHSPLTNVLHRWNLTATVKIWPHTICWCCYPIVHARWVNIRLARMSSARFKFKVHMVELNWSHVNLPWQGQQTLRCNNPVVEVVVVYQWSPKC